MPLLLAFCMCVYVYTCVCVCVGWGRVYSRGGSPRWKASLQCLNKYRVRVIWSVGVGQPGPQLSSKSRLLPHLETPLSSQGDEGHMSGDPEGFGRTRGPPALASGWLYQRPLCLASQAAKGPSVGGGSSISPPCAVAIGPGSVETAGILLCLHGAWCPGCRSFEHISARGPRMPSPTQARK